MDSYRDEEELINRIKKNIKWVVVNRCRGNQKELAANLNVRDNTLSTYIKGDTKPPITFVYSLCRKYRIPIDTFLDKDLINEDMKQVHKEETKKNLNKFMGTYHGYFFVIDSNSEKEGLIQEALITIYLKQDNKEMKLDSKVEVKFEIMNSGKEFIGSISELDELVYINLKNRNEIINIIMKSPGKNINEKYTGGIGIATIPSPEDSRIPSVQKIIISSAKISVREYYKSLREFLKVRTYFKIKKKLLREIFIAIMKISEEKQRKLSELLMDIKISEGDKIEVDEGKLELIQRVLSKDEFLKFKYHVAEAQNSKDILPFEGIKVQLEEDKMFYRFIKNEFNISKP